MLTMECLGLPRVGFPACCPLQLSANAVEALNTVTDTRVCNVKHKLWTCVQWYTANVMTVKSVIVDIMIWRVSHLCVFCCIMMYNTIHIAICVIISWLFWGRRWQWWCTIFVSWIDCLDVLAINWIDSFVCCVWIMLHLKCKKRHNVEYLWANSDCLLLQMVKIFDKFFPGIL